jgi:hypothetical protein
MPNLPTDADETESENKEGEGCLMLAGLIITIAFALPASVLLSDSVARNIGFRIVHALIY